jgi:hypothetical protein
MSDPIRLKARAVRLIDELADMVTTLNLMSGMQAGRVAKTRRAQILCAKAAGRLQAILQAVENLARGGKQAKEPEFQI